MQLTYQAIRTYREERDIWMDAYYKLEATSTAYAADMKISLSELHKELEDERKAWRGEVRKARRPGIGIFIGAGVTADGEFNPVIGIGGVLKLF
jgi:hypothetical protein